MGYYIIYPIFYLLSLLPFCILYFFSDILFVLLFYVFKYRRRVVQDNLSKSFPNYSKTELNRIEKDFFKFLCDLIVETLKLLTISEKQIKARCRYSEKIMKTFQTAYSDGNNIMILMGHFGNWEWAGASYNLHFPNANYALYHPLSNKSFNKLMIKIRTRFGTKLLPMKTAYRDILMNKNNASVFSFIADQCPSLQNSFWMNFLNQDTAVYYGPEKINNRLNCLVVFISLKKEKRGYYSADVHEVTNNQADTYPIMSNFMVLLEKEIIRQPHIWLWSHKRWKYKK